MAFVVATLLMVLGGSHGPGATDVVVMKSGTIHEGAVSSFDRGELVLTIESGKTILDRKDIASIHFGVTKAAYERRRAGTGRPTDPAKPRENALPMGAPHVGEGYKITLVGARVGTTKVRDMFGDMKTGKTPDLILTLRFENTDDRKILRYKEENMFLAGHFALRDDVGNTIRGVNYGLGNVVVGALTGNEDILPGKSATHVEVFSVPPPKTKSLTLTVKLGALGHEGAVKFRVKATEIRGFGVGGR